MIIYLESSINNVFSLRRNIQTYSSIQDVPGCFGFFPTCGPRSASLNLVDYLIEDFQMKFDVNSTEAAVALLADCLEFLPDVGDPDDPDDPLHDDFLRACRLNAQLNETEWRKSDNILCASTLRLAECGCQLTLGDGTDFPDVLPKPSTLGFPLGTWSAIDALPAGCAYVDPGDGSPHIVACDLSAAEVLANADELKAHCAERYGPNVVVHVPVDGSLGTCDPPADEAYTDTCPAQPWVLED